MYFKTQLQGLYYKFDLGPLAYGLNLQFGLAGPDTEATTSPITESAADFAFKYKQYPLWK